jgi:hypothetical protein
MENVKELEARLQEVISDFVLDADGIAIDRLNEAIDCLKRINNKMVDRAIALVSEKKL